MTFVEKANLRNQAISDARSAVPENLIPFRGPEHKPFQIGAGPGGALLLHGFTGTPAEVKPLAENLAPFGWRLAAPLLPGFGPDIVNLNRRGRSDWLAHARSAWADVAQSKPRLLVGFSMGAALSIHLAHEDPPDLLVLLAPFWRQPGFLARLVPLARRLLPPLRPFRKADFSDPNLRLNIERYLPDADLDDPYVQERIRQDFVLPINAIHEVFQFGAAAAGLAPSLRCPVLVVQGEQDSVVHPRQTHRLVEKLPPSHTHYEQISGRHQLLASGSASLERVTTLITSRLNPHMPEDRRTD